MSILRVNLGTSVSVKKPKETVLCEAHAKRTLCRKIPKREELFHSEVKRNKIGEMDGTCNKEDKKR